jgi:hypothetical protein
LHQDLHFCVPHTKERISVDGLPVPTERRASSRTISAQR